VERRVSGLKSRGYGVIASSKVSFRAIALKLPRGCEVNNHCPTQPLIA
jgi:hypothetical protein